MILHIRIVWKAVIKLETLGSFNDLYVCIIGIKTTIVCHTESAPIVLMSRQYI